MRKIILIVLLLLIPFMAWAGQPDKKETPQISEAQAREVIQKALKEKQEAFLKEYQALCKKYGLQIKADIQYSIAPLEGR